MTERLRKAKSLSEEMPAFDHVFNMMAIERLDINLDDVVSFIRENAGVSEETIKRAIWGKFDPDCIRGMDTRERARYYQNKPAAQTPSFDDLVPAPEKKMTMDEYVDHLLVLGLGAGADISKVTPENVLHVRLFLALAARRGVRRDLVHAALQNPDALLDIPLGDAKFPSFDEMTGRTESP